MDAPARAVLKARKARPFVYRHPWVFSGSISHLDGDPDEGDEVTLHDSSGNFIARGLFNPRSQIRIRLYSWNGERPLDRAFFEEKILAAIQHRNALLDSGTFAQDEAYRLINSEGDGLSGLVVDVYPPFAVVQFLALGLEKRRDIILEILRESAGLENVYERSDGPICSYEGLPDRQGVLWGDEPPDPMPMKENGIELLVSLQRGHKTGHYLDQRSNRARAAELAKSGRVLDMFCYTGSFGIHVAGQASNLLGVDESEGALQLARENAAKSGFSEKRAEFIKGSAVPTLRHFVETGEKFDTVILDPPKFAHSRHERDHAFRGYREINRLAFRLLNPGGILVSCSCSGAITMDDLEEALHEAAYDAKRNAQIIETHSHPPDHPILLSCPESRYLKCFIVRAW